MSKMLRSSGAMGAATLLSRVLGMVREILYARFMGTTWVADAFIFAFMVPSLFRRLLGEGALTAAFVPIFKATEKTEGEIEMWKTANAVISGLVVVCSLLVGAVLLGISLWIVWKEPAGQTRLLLELLRIMFPYMLLVCIAAVFIGMLNSRGHFFIPAMGAAMLNVVMISTVLILELRQDVPLERRIFGLAVGVLISGVAQCAFQVPSLVKEGYRPAWVTPWANPAVREVVRRMIPGTLGVAAFQVNVLMTQLIAVTYGASILASFTYGVRLMELPQGVFGISLATFLLPTLSGLASEKNFPEFRATLSEGVGYILFINGLAAVLMAVLAEPIVRLLFERGEFDAASTLGSSRAVLGLAPGLIAFSLVNILARAFYAVGDTATPMRISIFCLLLNILLAALLIFPLQQLGLGLANSITAVLNAGLLIYCLRKKLGRLEWSGVIRQGPALLGILFLVGFSAWWIGGWCENRFGSEALAARMGIVFLPAGVAVGLGFGLGVWLKLPAALAILDLAGRKK